MERRCHTADHSLSAESCSETTLQRHPHEDFRPWALWNTGISCHLHRLLPRLARMQGIFDLRALISSDSQLTASIFSLVCRGSRDWAACLFHLIAAPSLLFEWTISATPDYIYRSGWDALLYPIA
ncbi:hypothetical protein GGI43DRAFT_370549 [Trichoderma evansii]